MTRTFICWMLGLPCREGGYWRWRRDGYIARRRPRLARGRRRAVWRRPTILPFGRERGGVERRGARGAAPSARRRSAFWCRRPSPERPERAGGRDERARGQVERSWAGR